MIVYLVNRARLCAVWGAGSFGGRPPDFVRLRLAEASGIADSTKGRISANFCPKSNLKIVFSVIFRGAFESVFAYIFFIDGKK